MSLFEVNTYELENCANRLKSISEKLDNGRGMPLVSRAIGSISYFTGLDITPHINGLSDICAEMKTLSDDLMSLGNVLLKVSEVSQKTDAAVSSIFSGFLPQQTENSNKHPYQYDENSNMYYYYDEEGRRVNVIHINDNGEWTLNEDGTGYTNNDNEIQRVNTNTRSFDSSIPNANGNYQGYKIVSKLSPEDCFCQRNYDKFISPNTGSNAGCTATAIAIAYSIANETGLNPAEVGWVTGGGVINSEWNKYSTVVLPMGGYTEEEALKVCYEQINNGTPLLMRVQKDSSDYGHHITVVGISENADPNKLKKSDFLLLDPWDGKVKRFDELNRTKIDTTWSLRVPKTSA